VNKFLRITAMVLMAAAAVACGRKGPLEAPQASAPKPPARPEAQPGDTQVTPQSPATKPTVDIPPQNND
jgi:predicted small lipoprotein YifL